jgi:hypothetical protein
VPFQGVCEDAAKKIQPNRLQYKEKWKRIRFIPLQHQISSLVFTRQIMSGSGPNRLLRIAAAALVVGPALSYGESASGAGMPETAADERKCEGKFTKTLMDAQAEANRNYDSVSFSAAADILEALRDPDAGISPQIRLNIALVVLSGRTGELAGEECASYVSRRLLSLPLRPEDPSATPLGSIVDPSHG